jgi:tRNA pseudouridine55 synthase
MTLGQTSTTGDDEGEKTAVSDVQPTKDAVLAALDEFTGDIMQTPPAYSAIKVDGQRAYKLARAGKEVTIQPRQVTVYGLEMTSYQYPVVKFTSKVSSGTYIRSLVADIGAKLEVGAYMSGLVRTEIGMFKLADAINMDEATIDVIAQNLREITT